VATDSQLVLNSRGGNYTVALQDVAGASGTGLIEIYDIERSDPLVSDVRHGTLANLSVRGRVGSSMDPLIAGFRINDPTGFDRSMKILVRVVGPTLAGFGVTTPVSNPRLTIFDAAGRALATNDDWSSATNPNETETAAAMVGAFALPSGSGDAALALDLPAGSYTVHASSVDASGGVALVEIYRVP
jgi:hypothetical protein